MNLRFIFLFLLFGLALTRPTPNIFNDLWGGFKKHVVNPIKEGVKKHIVDPFKEKVVDKVNEKVIEPIKGFVQDPDAAIDKIARKIFGEVGPLCAIRIAKEMKTLPDTFTAAESVKGYTDSFDEEDKNAYGVPVPDLSPDSGHMLYLFAEMCAFTYCRAADDFERMATLNMRSGKFKVIAKDILDGEGHQWFIATNSERNFTVLAFRGSQLFGDWLANIQVHAAKDGKMRELFPDAPGHSQMHDGFIDHYNGFKGEVERGIAEALAADPSILSTNFYVTGHSLGGAMAFIAGADFMVRPEKLHGLKIAGVYTYGQPNVGTKDLSNHLAEIIGTNKYFRYVHGNDVVPNVGLFQDGAQPTVAHEYFNEGTEKSIQKCPLDDPQACSNIYHCDQMSFGPHTHIGSMPLHESICLITEPIVF